MENLYSGTGEVHFGLVKCEVDSSCPPQQYPLYTIYFISNGSGTFHADFGKFKFSGPALLFSTPLQQIYLEPDGRLNFIQMQFHGDFYCIEYHRNEVACNGLLFNSIYIDPIVTLTNEQAVSFSDLLGEIFSEHENPHTSDIVLRAYLQLFLAKSSSIKLQSLKESNGFAKDQAMEEFKQLLEENFLNLRKPSDYATLLAMSPNNFTRRCSTYFKKSPSAMIQERIILESKKQLHLTRLSIKEIAYNLKFQDEFYFSRVFKKSVKVSPQAFRKQTGISIVADLSKA